MLLKVFQIYKPDTSTIDEIQDRYAISKDMTTIAVADGTTQGYRSEILAQYLVDEFIKFPTFTKNGFQAFVNDIPDIDHLSKGSRMATNQSIAWLTKRKKEEGSSAAFMGIQLDQKKNKYKAIAYGDCKLFIIRGNKLVRSFPESSYASFINSKHKQLEDSHIFSENGDLKKNDRLIIATDAFADFIISDVKSYINVITNLNSFDDFINLVERSFQNKVLEMDDITLIDIYLDQRNQVKNFEPPNTFKYNDQLMPIKKPELNIGSDKKDTEMRKLLEILRFEKSELEGDVSDYKKMTSYLIVMNLVQWVIIMTLILYLAIPELYDFVKTQFNKNKFTVTTTRETIRENLKLNIEKKSIKPLESLEEEEKRSIEHKKSTENNDAKIESENKK